MPTVQGVCSGSGKSSSEISRVVPRRPIKWIGLLWQGWENHFRTQVEKNGRNCGFFASFNGVRTWFGGWAWTRKKILAELLARTPHGLLNGLGCFGGAASVIF